MHRLGVIGNGFVGKATCALRNDRVHVLAYDTVPAACDPPGTSLADVAACDIVFVSVPTPMDATTGEVHLSIVEAVVRDVRRLNSDAFIVVRSTVPSGTCDRLGVCFMPEFLTEANSVDDFRQTKSWIFGLPAPNPAFATKMQTVLQVCRAAGCIRSSHVTWMRCAEAEMVKYFRNTYLAAKVAYCNEISTLCGALGVDYDRIRQVAASDSRIGLSHTAVPGPDGRRGFGGTCFPKDCHGLRTQYARQKVPCPLLQATLQRNETLDRPDKDWLSSVGRAVREDSPTCDGSTD